MKSFVIVMAALVFSTAAHAANPLAGFPEFDGCQTAKGTWWKGNTAEKYTYKHNSSFAVTNGVLHTAGDWDEAMKTLAPVKKVERLSGGQLSITTSTNSRWELAKTSNGFLGTSFSQSGTPANLEFVCGQ